MSRCLRTVVVAVCVALAGAGSAESVTQFHRTEVRGFTASLGPVGPGTAHGWLGGKITVVKGRPSATMVWTLSLQGLSGGSVEVNLRSIHSGVVGPVIVRVCATCRFHAKGALAFCTPRPWFRAVMAAIPPLYVEIRTGPRPARMLGGKVELGFMQAGGPEPNVIKKCADRTAQDRSVR